FDSEGNTLDTAGNRLDFTFDENDIYYDDNGTEKQGKDINNNGSSTDTVTYKADFYEYDDIYDSSDNGSDPLNNLVVDVSAPITTGSILPFEKTWSQEVYVRKGQIIRFNP